MYEHDATEIAFKNGYKKCAKDIIEFLKNFEGNTQAAAEELERKYEENNDLYLF